MNKSITDTIEKMRSLFALNKEPVLGIFKGKIVLCNNASIRFLGNDLENISASLIVPEHILSEEASSFISSGMFRGKPAAASITRFDELLIISLTPAESEKKPAMFVPQSLVNSLRSSAATMKIAADQILNRLDISFDSTLEKYTSMMYHSYFTMLRLTVNLETVNGISDGSLTHAPRIWDMVQLCSDLVSTISHMLKGSGLNISFVTKEHELNAYVDIKRIEQLILNLITNSLLHTSPGDTIVLSLKKAGESIIISVDDTGSGIPPRILSTIFSRFDENITLAELAEGSGLGLNIAKGIAEKHGGALMIESREGSGTTVRVMFPANISENHSLHSPPPPIDGMNDVLRELSVALSYEQYQPEYLD